MGLHKGTVTLVLLLLVSSLYAIDPPSKTVKKRHGQAGTLYWDYTPAPGFTLKYWLIKATYDLNVPPTEIARAAPTAESKTIVVMFTPEYPDFVYFVVSGVYDSPRGQVESSYSPTFGAARIGPPPP